MNILVLPGDGIGPEITAATRQVLARLNDGQRLGLSLETHEIGLASLAKRETTLPEEVCERARSTGALILGPLSTLDYPPPEDGGVNPSAHFRQALDLYANLRPSGRYTAGPGIRGAFDLVIVRENSEGFYACRSLHAGAGEFMPDPNTAFALRKITRDASARIAAIAFALARRRRRKLSIVHKANVLGLSDGLFLAAAREVAKDYADVAVEELLVDAAAALLVREPARFDVVLTTNMFGDILSNLAAELGGGLGLGPSLNHGATCAMAQAAHGSAPDIAGEDRANPSALMLSAAMLLDWLGARHDRGDLRAAAAHLDRALRRTLRAPESRTADLGGPLGTRAFAEAVAGNLAP